MEVAESIGNNTREGLSPAEALSYMRFEVPFKKNLLRSSKTDNKMKIYIKRGLEGVWPY